MRLKSHILFHRATPWHSEIRCSTKIFAEQFKAHGFYVTYLQILIHPLRLFKSKFRKAIKTGNYKEDMLHVISAFTFVPFLKKMLSSKMATLSYQSVFPSLKKVVSQAIGTPQIIWTVPPGSSALKRLFPKAKLIMQVVDYYPAFLGEKIKEIEKKDYELADHIFTVGNTLKAYLINDLQISSAKITVLGQGVDNYRYTNNLKEPEDLKKAKGTRFVYVGLLNKCDGPMMKELIEYIRSIDGSLVLIGPEAEWATNLNGQFKEEIILLGAKSPEEVPAYLMHCHIGLMLYDQTKQAIYKGQHPLKLYEYAAAGLPVISTPHDEYSFLKPPVECINSLTELRPALHKLVRNRLVIGTKMKQFANKYDWKKTYAKALGKIEMLDSFNNYG